MPINRKNLFSIFKIPLHLRRSQYDEVDIHTAHFLFICNPRKVPKGTPPPREFIYHKISLKGERHTVRCTPMRQLPFTMWYSPPSEMTTEISMTLSEDRHPDTDHQTGIQMQVFNPTGQIIKGFLAIQFYRNTTLDLIHRHHYWQWFIVHSSHCHVVPYSTQAHPLDGGRLANLL